MARYSEDIDITIDTKISQGQKKALKENLEELAEELGLSIPNLSETRSRRSYNKYVIQYEPLYLPADAAIQSGVLLETSFAEISFPVVTMDVHRERTLCDLLRPRNHTDIQIVAAAFKQSEKNIPAQLVLQNYLLERFLERVSVGQQAERARDRRAAGEHSVGE
ncbi:MAG: nucleotidyl transferase AbiEii/AbiGii toxin family protein [Veillonellaceae bacterium]|nr:nucleotidyl transferase AbiEii/AbiGii toxin family protein [Veillonellaceae bacterium]MDD6697144.1 nucleotidyl transferase AbiEii/AbiGii toxin family protein [Veillonellaceae bacterium]